MSGNDQKKDDALRSAEMSVEQNYNMIGDGMINNEKRKADLTDGQTLEEIRELAQEMLPEEDANRKKPPLVSHQDFEDELHKAMAGFTFTPENAPLDAAGLTQVLSGVLDVATQERPSVLAQLREAQKQARPQKTVKMPGVSKKDTSRNERER